jgi:hypothetical protein
MRFVTITDRKGAKLAIEFGGAHAQRPLEVLDVDEFIAIKSHRAKGKRLTTYEVAKLTFIEPEEPEEEPEELDEEMPDMSDEAVGADVVDDEEVIDLDDLVGDDVKIDPNVDYSKRPEVDDVGFSAAQLDLF